MDLTEFVEKVLGIEMTIAQKEIIKKWEPIMKSMNEIKTKCCANCAEKQLNLCKGINVNHRFGISGCSKAIAMYSEAVNKLIDNKSPDFDT